MFAQNLKEFFTSKVNIFGLLSIAGLTYAFVQGLLTWTEYQTAISPVLIGMGLRDTVFRLKG